VKAGGHELTGRLALHLPAANAPAGTSIFALGVLAAVFFALSFVFGGGSSFIVRNDMNQLQFN
jgi:hypothetical protein